MMNYMNQNSGAILVILTTLALIGAGVGWITGEINNVRDEITVVRSEITDVRGEITVVRGEVGDLRGEVGDLRQDQVAMERRLTEKIQATDASLAGTDARVAAVQQSLAQLEAKVDALLEAIANHSHTEDGVSFARPVAEPQTGGN